MASFSEELRRAYHTATVDNEPVSCLVTMQLMPDDDDQSSYLDCINGFLISPAVNSFTRLLELD